MIKKINSQNAPQPIGPYSQACFDGKTLYCSGQIALDASTGEFLNGNINEQTEKVMQNIGAVLEAAGLGFKNVIKTTCFLHDMADFSEFNKIYEKYFISKPARSCVAAKTLPKNALVEVEVIAVANL